MGENSTAVRVAIVGVGNCASSLVQASTTTRMPTRPRRSPAHARQVR